MAKVHLTRQFMKSLLNFQLSSTVFPIYVFCLGNATSSNQELASYFECPVCFDYALPPIMQCQSGHIVCQSCRQKLSMCPTCRGPLGKSCVHVYHVYFIFHIINLVITNGILVQ